MIFLEIFRPLGSDFVVYFEAARVFLSGSNPYLGLITRAFPFNYPPTSLLFLWPLGFLDFQMASVIWNVLSTVALLVSIGLICRIRRIGRVWFIFLAILFTLVFFPVKFNIGNGQINHFLLLFVSGSLYFYHLQKKRASALLLAFAVGIKLAPVIFLLYFVILRDWRQIKRVFGVILALFGLSLIFVPWQYQLVYFRDVFPLSFTLAAKDWYYNQSLWGLLSRFFSNSAAIYLSAYFLTTSIVFLTWWQGQKVPKIRALAAVSCLYLLIHPIALQHYFGFAIIPLILLLDRKNWLMLLIAYLLLAFDIKNFAAVPKEFSLVLSHDFYALLLLWTLALWQRSAGKITVGYWSVLILGTYILSLLCRANFCF